jgi:fermentation-respiration switch protein FrsA (DUF1100 family)
LAIGDRRSADNHSGPRGGTTVRAVKLVLAAIALVALSIAVLPALERFFIYFPIRQHVATPAEYGLRADDFAVETDVGLRGWWIRGGGRFVLVWFDGNAGNISHRLENARVLVDRFGVDLVQVDYRGYGLSEGTPDEAGFYRDGLAVYDAVAARGLPGARIVAFGRSIGAAVALDIAVQRPVAGVILETPFLSVAEMAREHYPFIPSRLLRTRFDSLNRIARLRAPVLILHGDEDEIVPIAHGRQLFDRASHPKQFFTIPGASHNDTWLVGGEPYWQAWERFLAGL